MEEICLMMLNMMFGSNITTDTIRENNSVLKKAFDKNISETEFEDAVMELSENLKIDKDIIRQAIKAAKGKLLKQEK
jgi:hypothetical protein